MRLGPFILTAALLAAPHAGADQTASAAEPIVVMTNPAAVALALREEGYRAKLTRDDFDRTVINTGVAGLQFDIIFVRCNGDIGCEGLLLTAGFDLANGIGLERVNAWNLDRLMGRAFTDDECDPYLDHYLGADPLMSAGAFADLLHDWEIALTEFAGFIGFGDDTPRAAVAGCGPGTDAI